MFVTVAAGSDFVPELREWAWMDHLTSLLTAARDGDRDALERFVAETRAEVWTMCRYLGDSGYADDLAQETYERAIGSLHRYRAEGSARGWLLTIARRVCVDHTRRAVRRRRLDRSVIHDTTAGWHGGGPTAPDASGRIELDELLGNLDDDRRAAFVLTQVLGRHYDEAAEVLGCPVGTVRSRVSRARRDLVAMMAGADGTADGAAGDAAQTPPPDLGARRSAGGR
jgi:RNA polymerase sigma-70 factor (ECF subfamily)